MKHVGDFRREFSGRAIFRMQDVAVFLAARGARRAYAHTLIHRLRRGAGLRRITRGVYTFRAEGEVVGFAFTPFYYGLQDALSLRDLWEQETIPVIVTPRNVRCGLRTLAGVRVLVRRLPRQFFFGYDFVRRGPFHLPVSDLEKTLLDFRYFREPLRDDVLRSLRRRARTNVLRAYLRRMPDRLRTGPRPPDRRTSGGPAVRRAGRHPRRGRGR